MAQTEQYGQIIGVVVNTNKLSGSISPIGRISGSLEKAAVSYEKDYKKLDNKPSINGEELIDDKTSEDLHIVACKTSAEWAQLTTLVSMPGEIYVYSDGGGTDPQGKPIPKLKIGDGNAYVVDLPFAASIDMRITDQDIANWNNKVAVRIEGDRLIFY